MTNPTPSVQKMLNMQADLQKNSYGRDLRALKGDHLMEQVRNNVLALEDELHEALAETGWKPWSTSNHMNVEAFRSELIDAWHFFMNLMLLCGMDSYDLYQGYVAKHELNAQRQREGYDGVSTKCPRCKRALDDHTTVCWVEPDGRAGYCEDLGTWAEVPSQNKKEN